MNMHISFPSIGQFRDVVKQVHSGAKYFNTPVPVIKFTGTVKLHGTNFSICRHVNGCVDDIYFQSKERIITPDDDNYGSAAWGNENKTQLNEMFNSIAEFHPGVDEIIQIYGEWAGGSIQRGVGIKKIPKSFFVFAIRVSRDSESTNWFSRSEIEKVFRRDSPNMYLIYDFPTFEVSVDFTRPEFTQNHLIEITTAIEKECPVAKQLVSCDEWRDLIGEGAVWMVSENQDLPFNCEHYRFKVKGEKHSVSKCKTLVPVDVEKVESVEAFVEMTVTENRLLQGIDKLREMNLDIVSTNTGAFIKWVMGDVFKEEMDTLLESGLTTKDVTNKMAAKARNFYMRQI